MADRPCESKTVKDTQRDFRYFNQAPLSIIHYWTHIKPEVPVSGRTESERGVERVRTVTSAGCNVSQNCRRSRETPLP